MLNIILRHLATGVPGQNISNILSTHKFSGHFGAMQPYCHLYTVEPS